MRLRRRLKTKVEMLKMVKEIQKVVKETLQVVNGRLNLKQQQLIHLLPKRSLP